jgi:hypothetical protein
VLVALLAWWTLRLASGSSTWCFVDWVNVPFHEAGHVFLGVCGSTLHFLGGTILQLAVPALLVWYFLARRREAFGSACCLWWVGESLNNASIYMADARDLALPLIAGGEHDWNELFFRFGVLDEPSVVAISRTTHVVAALLMLIGLAWAVVLVLPSRVRSRLVLRVAGVASRAVRMLQP